MRQRKKMILFALVVALMLPTAVALAETNTPNGLDGAGNLFVFDGNASGQTINRDLYAFGQTINASSSQVTESMILAGQYVNVNNSTIGGSLRAAAYQISTLNTTVDVNATLAAYSIDMGQDFSAKAIYATASNISFAGKCDSLNLTAQSVTVSGTVIGDANIVADSVLISPQAVITGTLNVTSESEPIIAGNASVGRLNFQQITKNVEPTVAARAASKFGAFLSKVSRLIMLLPGRILLAVLYYFIIRKSVNSAAEMVKGRPAAMPVSGLVALVSVPILCIMLLITYIGVPAGLLLACLYALALSFSVSFAGCMAGKLMFPKMHTLLAYIIGVAILSVAKVFPYVGGLLTFVSMLYTLGYFIQKIYLEFSKKEVSVPEATALPAVEEPAQQVEQL